MVYVLHRDRYNIQGWLVSEKIYEIWKNKSSRSFNIYFKHMLKIVKYNNYLSL